MRGLSKGHQFRPVARAESACWGADLLLFSVGPHDEGACASVQDSSSRRAVRPDPDGFLGEGLQVGLGFPAVERRWRAGREGYASLHEATSVHSAACTGVTGSIHAARPTDRQPVTVRSPGVTSASVTRRRGSSAGGGGASSPGDAPT